MACNISLRTDLLTGADSGGSWTYLGFSSTLGGSYTGSLPAGWDLSTDDPSIDTVGVDPGFYKFKYEGSGTGDCGGEVEVILQVVAGCHFTPVGNKAYCQGEPFTANLLDPASVGCDYDVVIAAGSDPLPVDVTLDAGAGTVTALSGATNNHVGETYIFDITPSVPGANNVESGYTLDNCDPCAPQPYQVSITINNQFEAGTAVLVAACN